MMRASMLRSAALLPICLMVGGCLTGTRPPLWSIYGDPTTQTPAVAGTSGVTGTPVVAGSPVVIDQRIEMYSLPAFSLRLGGFQAYHYPYPYYLHYLHPYAYPYPHRSYAGCCVRARPAISRRPALPGPLGPRKSFGLVPPLPRLTTR